jgi:three-Cys-motif partner protein
VGKDDQEHFNQYTPQNRVKHAVLEKYFAAYLKALQSTVGAFHYIDGFAGGGLYQMQYVGSPLIAMRLLESQKLPFAFTCVERDSTLFESLKETLGARPRSRLLVQDPMLRLGEFTDYIDTALNAAIYSQYRKVATFAFIDPCGASGVLMNDIEKLLARPFGECLLFWNYDGIKRWLGGLSAGTHPGEGLAKLFGSAEYVREARDLVASKKLGEDQEKRLLALFLKALNGRRAQFTLPFRVEAKDRDRTSHYLIHCSSHWLAFKIMKDIMGGLTLETTEAGSFEFSSAAKTRSLFTPGADFARDKVIAELQTGARRVGLFTEEWIRRADDYYREKDYKELLLMMESSGDIEVLAKDWRTPAPRESRRAGRGGGPTLGNELIVRLKNVRSANP